MFRQIVCVTTALMMIAVGSTRSANAQSRTNADQAASAPLGLTWAKSKKELQALGIVFADEKEGVFGQQAFARNLPKVLADTDGVVLYFGYDDKLWRVFIASVTWNNDQYGVRGKSRFDELSSVLTDRYGRGRDIMRVPSNEFYQKPENFAYSISQRERIHARGWETEFISLELAINANHQSTFCGLIYEYKPLVVEFQRQKKLREKEAL
jgi:hypothetical protein